MNSMARIDADLVEIKCGTADFVCKVLRNFRAPRIPNNWVVAVGGETSAERAAILRCRRTPERIQSSPRNTASADPVAIHLSSVSARN